MSRSVAVVLLLLSLPACASSRRNSGIEPPTTPTTAATEARVVVGSLAITVPAGWPQTAVPGHACLDLRAPGVLIGTLTAVRKCYMQTTADGPAVTFASGGPPD